MQNAYRLLGTALLLVSVTTLACGGDDDDEGPSIDGASPPGLTLQEQPDVVQELDTELTASEGGGFGIEARGALFAPNKLGMAVGDSATLRLTNKDGQTHNLRIAGLDGQYETEDDAAVPDAGQSEIGEVNFTPPVAGAYTFRCDFHPGTMGGQVIVQ